MREFLGFTRYTKKRNAIHYGTLYQKEMLIPYFNNEKRTLHVWLPESYDGKKRFGVIYCSDAQNMVDHYQTAYGEWDAEDRIYERAKKKKKEYILVGLSCPNDEIKRCKEYTPYRPNKIKFLKKFFYQKTCGKQYGDFIVNIIKPLIDQTFLTLPDITGFLGSSMGGLISFYMGINYPHIFKFIFSYSPAFFAYRKFTFKRLFFKEKPLPGSLPLLLIYCGYSDELEKTLLPMTEYVVNKLRKFGFNEDYLYYSFDKKSYHHEKCWSQELTRSFKYLEKHNY